MKFNVLNYRTLQQQKTNTEITEQFATTDTSLSPQIVHVNITEILHLSFFRIASFKLLPTRIYDKYPQLTNNELTTLLIVQLNATSGESRIYHLINLSLHQC